MSYEFKLTSEFPFASGGKRQFSYFGPNDLHIKVEAPTHKLASEVGKGIAQAMEDGPCTAAKIAAHGYINKANETETALACTLSYDLA